MTQTGVSPDRLQQMDFALAVERFEIEIFSRSGETNCFSDLDSLAGLTACVQTDNLGETFADNHGGLDVVRFDTLPRLVDGLEDGSVDVMLFPRRAAHAEIQRRGTDGHDILHAIKSEEITRKLPIVVMTSSRDQADIDRGYDAGANSYVVKPVDLEGVLGAIARLREYWLKIVVLPRVGWRLS
ncbi:transporter substrate-binding domain-containing protein [Roseobacter sp.]|uniref:response regulator n=1 Tax=Roseobacter sp. TaxID=1907202 RepID=UPI003298226C